MTDKLKTFMVDLVQEAGEFLAGYFQRDRELVTLRCTAKEAATRYDTLTDRLIVEKIRVAYPSHSLLTEESGYHHAHRDWLWVVDSLDGTGNFANGNPFFSVCLALIHRGKLTLAALYAPAIGELYVAERGKGAFLNHRRIQVSTTGELGRSYLFYCEGGDTKRERTGSLLQAVYPVVTDIRKLGSAGIETAWVAAGRGEAYFTTKIDPWDVAPGVLLVLEAGGQVTDFSGREWKPERGNFLFSNGLVHAGILERLSRETVSGETTTENG